MQCDHPQKRVIIISIVTGELLRHELHGSNERREGRADWSKMISELENFGKMEISGILTDLSAPVNSQRPSASSPHDNNATVPPPHIPVSICLCSAYLCVHT